MVVLGAVHILRQLLTKGGGGKSQKLTIADEGRRGISRMLTIADKGGEGQKFFQHKGFKGSKNVGRENN